jgi:hypothetical protein
MILLASAPQDYLEIDLRLPDLFINQDLKPTASEITHVLKDFLIKINIDFII